LSPPQKWTHLPDNAIIKAFHPPWKPWPYSLAIAIQDFVAGNPNLELRAENFPILATDVSGKSLATAREGRFPNHLIDRGLTIEHRTRYFRPEGNLWVASEELCRMIEFRRLNLIDRLNVAGQFDVIFCRNVLIYFDTPVRQRVCQQFHELLIPGGLLIVGAAESLYRLETPLVTEYLGATTVYRKLAAGHSGL